MTTDAMAPKFSYLKIKEEYVLITKRNFCAAKILAIIEGWLEWKAKHKHKFDDWDWIRLPIEKIRDCLFGEYGIETIRNAVTYLHNQLKLIDRRLNDKAPYDRAYQYQLDRKAIKQAIAKLQKEPETLANDDPPNGEVSPLASQGVIPQGEGDHNKLESTYSSTNSSTGSEASEPEFSKPEEQESNLETSATAVDQNSTSVKTEDSAQDQGSAAPKNSVFTKFDIKPPQPKPEPAIAGFPQWYAVANRQHGLAIAAQQVEGIQWVQMRDERWVLWSDVRDRTWAELGQLYPRQYKALDVPQIVVTAQESTTADHLQRLKVKASLGKRSQALEEARQLGIEADLLAALGEPPPESAKVKQAIASYSVPTTRSQPKMMNPKTELGDWADIFDEVEKYL